MNVLEAISKRHSYRGKFKPDSIPREALIKIVQAGLDAPSGCNKQTTSFIAIDDPDVLQSIHAVIDPPIGETAPAAICVLTQRINAHRDRCFAVQDYSAAIQNMLLAIVELGYQSCWYVSCRLVLLKMNQRFLRKRHLSREPGSMDLIKSNFRVSLLV